MTQRLPKLYCRVLRRFVGTLLIAFAALRPAEAGSPSSGRGESAIVVDGNSGNVLYSAKSDELRHPASLTKIMTLYLLFERMEAGKFNLNSQLSVSQHASVQAPSKLGLRPGQTITVSKMPFGRWSPNRPMTWPWLSPRQSAVARANSPT
jgi:D-alanyl-D-alanine carboxypeptidase